MREIDEPVGTAESPETHHSNEASPVVAQIARGVVGVHARYYGRGPTKAKAIWRNDVVVVILEEIFTKAEETW